jgi:hypothetical protein
MKTKQNDKVKVNVQIDKSMDKKIKAIAKKKIWSKAQTIKLLLIKAFQHGLDKEL